jgi:hypothetical protein
MPGVLLIKKRAAGIFSLNSTTKHGLSSLQKVKTQVVNYFEIKASTLFDCVP